MQQWYTHTILGRLQYDAFSISGLLVTYLELWTYCCSFCLVTVIACELNVLTWYNYTLCQYCHGAWDRRTLGVSPRASHSSLFCNASLDFLASMLNKKGSLFWVQIELAIYGLGWFRVVCLQIQLLVFVSKCAFYTRVYKDTCELLDDCLKNEWGRYRTHLPKF